MAGIALNLAHSSNQAIVILILPSAVAPREDDHPILKQFLEASFLFHSAQLFAIAVRELNSGLPSRSTTCNLLGAGDVARTFFAKEYLNIMRYELTLCVWHTFNQTKQLCLRHMNLQWNKSYTVPTKEGRFRVFVAKHEEGYYAGCLYYAPGRAFHAPSNVTPLDFQYERRFAQTEQTAFDEIADWIKKKWGPDTQIVLD